MKLRRLMLLIAVLSILLLGIRNTEFQWNSTIKGLWLHATSRIMIGSYLSKRETAFVVWIDNYPYLGIGWIDKEFITQLNPKIEPQ